LPLQGLKPGCKVFHVIESFFLKGTFMKIRKSILAAATAATVSISGVVAAPAFAAENTGADDGTVTAKENNDGDKPKDEEKTFGEKLVENSSDDKGNLGSEADHRLDRCLHRCSQPHWQCSHLRSEELQLPEVLSLTSSS